MNSKNFLIALSVITVLSFSIYSCNEGKSMHNNGYGTAPDSNKLQLPTVSQLASVQQTIGVSDIAITYYRPNVKGRNIWGNVVKYDSIWEVGAEIATQFRLHDTAWVNGYSLPKGNYSFFIIPRADGPWTVIFNNLPIQYSTRQYDSKNNALSFNILPVSSPFTESLTFDIANVSGDTGLISMKWENKQIKFPVSFPSKRLAWKKIESYFATASSLPDSIRWANNFQIANYCLFSKDTVHIDQALQIIDSAMAIKPDDYGCLMVKSGLMELKGDYKQAMALAIQSIKKGSGNGMREEIADALDMNIKRYKTILATNTINQ